MQYTDENLEAMTHEELLVAAKYLRDRIREGYIFLIRKPGKQGSKIQSPHTGKTVEFADFVEQSRLGDKIAEYVAGILKSHGKQ